MRGRLEELEQRRTNPLLLQQEREFNQLIELQASVGRLQTKLEGVQSKREDIRERLLEARHVVALLEVLGVLAQPAIKAAMQARMSVL